MYLKESGGSSQEQPGQGQRAFSVGDQGIHVMLHKLTCRLGNGE